MERKIFIVALIVLVLGGVQAQDTVRYGDTNYYFMPYDSLVQIQYHIPIFGAPDLHGYFGYYVSEPLTVYGIAVVSPYKPRYYSGDPTFFGSLIPFDTTSVSLDLHAMLIIKEGDSYHHVDSAKWYSRNPNKYFKYEHVPYPYTYSTPIDTVVPVYEFYFSTPQLVFDTFGVGLYSTHANFDRQGNFVSYSYGCGRGTYLDTTMATQCLQLGWRLFWCVTDSSGQFVLEERNHLRFHHAGDSNPEHVHHYEKTGGAFFGGIFPIVVPPDTDSFECPRVENFCRAGYVDGHPKFRWDAQEGQGPFQIAYGPADQPVDSHRVATAMRQPYVLPDGGLDSTVLYVARCRGRCHHTCPLHDTIFWSEWSDAVEFWTGSRRPGSEGIVSPDDAVAFTLSPNPARNEVTVTLGSTVTSPCVVVLRDGQGRELLRQWMEGGEVTLSTRGLPAGLYLTTLESPQGSSTQKLVVER